MTVQRLEQYRKLRLDLGDAMRSLLYLARARHDEVIEADCRHLLKRLAEDRFTVAIVGQHSRGKTTLMNALLGDQYLPTGILPMTSVITVVRYGSEPGASYFRRGSDVALHVTIADVPALVARESATRAELQVDRVAIEVPAELLRLGMTFVDTPGVGSADETGAAKTRGFLPDADAVVFVTSVDSALTESELALLHDIPRSAPIFCVVNKVDLANDQEAESVVAFVDRVVRESTSRDDVRVMPISALEGLRHRVARFEHDGGLDQFQRLLESVLTSVRSHVALATSLDIARRIHADQRRMLQLAEFVDRTSSPERTSLESDIATEVELAVQRRTQIVRQMGDDSQHALDVETASRRAEWHAQLVAIYANDDRREGVTPQAGTRAEPAGSPEWWSTINAQLAESAAAAAFRHAHNLGATLNTGLVVASGRVGMVLPESARRGWQAVELPGFGRPSFSADGKALRPGDGLLGRTRRRHEEEVDRLLDAFIEHLRQQNRHRTEWIANDAARQADAAAERLAQYLTVAPSEPELDAMERILRRLDVIGTQLSAHPPRPGKYSARSSMSGATSAASVVEGSEDEQHSRRGRGFECVVCARQRAALIEDLRHRQLLIATRERDQGEFARIGGLCAQHTWTYASIASPVGIASAYAPLAYRAARRLTESLTAPDLIDTATAFGGDAANCPVCHTIARAEAETLRGLERRRPRVPLICLRHLNAAAAAGLPDDVLLELARHLEHELRRHADDLRTYALKREALAGGSLTMEENDAHKEVLLLIAGDPLLARPGSSSSGGLHADGSLAEETGP